MGSIPAYSSAPGESESEILFAVRPPKTDVEWNKIGFTPFQGQFDCQWGHCGLISTNMKQPMTPAKRAFGFKLVVITALSKRSHRMHIYNQVWRLEPTALGAGALPKSSRPVPGA